MIDLTCQLYQSQILLVRVSVIFYLKCVRKMSVSIFQYLEQCHHNCAERGREEIFFLELLFEMWISIVSIGVTKYIFLYFICIYILYVFYKNGFQVVICLDFLAKNFVYDVLWPARVSRRDNIKYCTRWPFNADIFCEFHNTKPRTFQD